MPGAQRLHDSKELQRLLQQQHQEGKLIGAICAAPAVVLTPLGLLDGLTATCHPGFVDKLKDSRYATSPLPVRCKRQTSACGNCNISEPQTVCGLRFLRSGIAAAGVCSDCRWWSIHIGLRRMAKRILSPEFELHVQQSGAACCE